MAERPGIGNDKPHVLLETESLKMFEPNGFVTKRELRLSGLHWSCASGQLVFE